MLFRSELVGAHAVIWTTTPWTIPVNQALAYGAEVGYELVELGTSGFLYDVVPGSMPVDDPDSPTWQKFKGRRLLVAANLRTDLLNRLAAAISQEIGRPLKGIDLLHQPLVINPNGA